jgi:2-keto-4-pentenoate hydratase/2-oxohepta-3-ene-1,7-dioic acid hydratase in catechol pathway
MRIACLLWQDNEQLAVVDVKGQSAAVKSMTSPQFWAAPHGERAQALDASATLATVDLEKATFLPPVPHPAKLLCVAVNYLEHLREGGGTDVFTDVRPQLFMKPPSTTLTGHRATVKLPKTVQHMDYEAELAVVLGKELYQPADYQEALAAVAGYSCFNDLSERKLKVDPRVDTRSKTPFFDWLTGKWLNGAAPMGPWLVTADEIPEPQKLHIESVLNGKLMQNASTALMLSSVAEIVWYAAQIMTLEPGDVIATGTPAGVGIAQDVAIKPGDTMDVTIERIGTLTTNFC